MSRGRLAGCAALTLVVFEASCLVSIPDLREKPGLGAGAGAAATANAGEGGQDGSTPEVGGRGGAAAELPARCSTAVEQVAPTRAFPDDAGLIDVTAAPYLARGDGVSDDTAALQQAITDYVGTGRMLFLPAGSYLVSSTLDAIDALGMPAPSITVQGAGRDQTRIQLAPAALGFDDAKAPAPVLRLNGNDRAFRNHVMDLSIDVGAHPGAVGLDFVGHNRSGIENVRLSAAPEGGAIGLKLERPYAGSRLIRNVTVEGFDVGVSIAQEKFGNTFEHLTLRGQRSLGIRNNRSFTVLRDLRSDNSVPALQSTHALGMLVVVEADLVGGSPKQPAISSEGEIYARDLVVAGYGPAIELRGLEVARGDIAEFSSREPTRLAATGSGSLGLPIRETPEPEPPAIEAWVSVTEHGAIADDELDDSVAIQAALDSGARAIYFPFGNYLVEKILTVPSTVELLFGAESTLTLAEGQDFIATMPGATPAPLFRIGAGETPLRAERLFFAAQGEAELGASLFEHIATRELTLALLEGEHVGHWPLLYRAEAGAGPLFLHNVHAGSVRLVSGQKAWIRAGNFEIDQPMIDNAGAELWALGLKSYRPHTLIATSAAGKTELLGAFLLPEPEEANPGPAFSVDDAEASLIFATYTDQSEGEYPVHVRETRAGVAQELLPDAERVLGSGSYVPLFVGHDRSVRLCE